MNIASARALALQAPIAAVLVWAVSASANPTYVTFDLPGQVNGSYPTGIAGNLIVGHYDDGASAHSFIRKPNGQFVIFDVPGSSYTLASCINDLGATAGSYYDGNFAEHGFIRDPGGAITTFDPPNAAGNVHVGGINHGGAVSGDDTASEFFIRDSAGNFTTFTVGASQVKSAGNINDAGYMVGTLASQVEFESAFVRKPNGNITQFLVGYDYTSAAAIDQNERITGSYFAAAGVRGYVRRPNGNIDRFRYSGVSIDGGKVTGSFQNAQSKFRGFIRSSNGAITRFDAPGADGTFPTGIWNGKVTGSYTDANGTHGFLRTP